ncbi:hypothetical protein Cba03nite_73280 [Catellatospora bangladeshensis]|uniref:Uncharacterized protein n=1 Tax=Catellatospora bangladeshensis TaxID=310355 RepID=A0A8J3JP46_9ACTN|nr:hypothetical protein Cba03nite_73280 [Catellatospora bangladeshensis]
MLARAVTGGTVAAAEVSDEPTVAGQATYGAVTHSDVGEFSVSVGDRTG